MDLEVHFRSACVPRGSLWGQLVKQACLSFIGVIYKTFSAFRVLWEEVFVEFSACKCRFPPVSTHHQALAVPHNTFPWKPAFPALDLMLRATISISLSCPWDLPMISIPPLSMTSQPVQVPPQKWPTRAWGPAPIAILSLLAILRTELLPAKRQKARVPMAPLAKDPTVPEGPCSSFMNYPNQHALWRLTAVFSAFFPLIVSHIGRACKNSTVTRVCRKYNSLSRVTDPFRANARRWLQ